MNKERMDEGKARISEDWGDFVSIETMQDAEIIQRGAHIAAVYVTAEYENIEVHYTGVQRGHEACVLRDPIAGSFLRKHIGKINILKISVIIS